MRTVAATLICLAFNFFGGSPTKAQVSGKSMLTRLSATDGAEVDCGDFYENAKPIPGDFTVRLPELRSCADDLMNDIPDPNAAGATAETALARLKTNYHLSTPDQVDEQLVKTHYLLRILRRWANLDKVQASVVITDVNQLDARMHTLMSYVGLLDPFAGSLVAGPVFGDTGKLSSSTTNPTAASTGTKTGALAHIEWGSKHFGEESSSPIDFSFGGSFGLQPSLTLLTSPPSASGSSSSASIATSEYQSAFLWSLHARGNLHTSSTAETSGFFRTGQVRLLSGNGATVVDQGGNSTLLIPLNGNADRLSWFYEGGLEFNYYSKSLEVVHAEKGQFNPLFDIAISYKLDTRFKQSAGVVGFDSPDRRLLFRFMLNGLKIFDRRPDTTASKPWAISFGVEHERGFGANPVPSGTQIVIRGDVELLKLINPGTTK